MKFIAGKRRNDSYEWPLAKKKKQTWKNRYNDDEFGEYREKDIDILRLYLNKSYGYQEMVGSEDEDFKPSKRNI